MKKRQLSNFMTQEMLYDYVTDHLDPDRRQLVEEEIQKSTEIHQDLMKIMSGIQYIERLSEADISDLLMEGVRRRMTYWEQVKKTLSAENWPPFFKWTLEAVLVISSVVIVSLLVPWAQVKDFVMRQSQNDIVLAEISKSQRKSLSEDLNALENQDKGSFEDEVTPAAPPAEVPTAPVDAKSPTPAKTASAQQKPVSAKIEEPKQKGFLYRGTLSVVNVEVGAAKLRDKVVELGGRKAGQVELGWKRNQGDYYFHFTIPESKLIELEEYFKTLGTTQLSRDPHPRVMPDGIIRLIITAEETQ